MLKKVWVETADEKTCLHVIRHGNENLIGYDEKLETRIVESPLTPEKVFNIYSFHQNGSGPPANIQ